MELAIIIFLNARDFLRGVYYFRIIFRADTEPYSVNEIAKIILLINNH